MAIFDRTCAQIHLDAIEHNYTCIRRVFGETAVMTVLKGNAYGHGIRGILPACDPHTDTYAVATVEEGAEVRCWGSRKPVLVFGPGPAARMVEGAAMGLTFTVGSLDYARSLSSNPSLPVYEIEGKAVQGDAFMEFYVDETALQQLVLNLFYAPVE